MAFIKVATLAEIHPGRTKQVIINGRKIGLFNVGGTIYALEDVCPHRGAPLTEGDLIDTEIVCPLHAAAFDLKTGQHLSPPARSGVAAFKVQVVGEEIQVDL